MSKARARFAGVSHFPVMPSVICPSTNGSNCKPRYGPWKISGQKEFQAVSKLNSIVGLSQKLGAVEYLFTKLLQFADADRHRAALLCNNAAMLDSRLFK